MLWVSFSSKFKATNVFEKYSEINSSKEETILSYYSKELFVQRFVEVFDQNWKHVEAQNRRTSTPADFLVLR